MAQGWKQWLAAFIMGAVMPGLVVRLAVAISSGAVQPEMPESTTVQTVPPLQEHQMLPVLDGGVVQIMELEAYLVGVVLAEMPADFHTEALKAQAVAARTCALQCAAQGEKHPGGAVCTDSGCCQAYIAEAVYRSDGGTEENVEKVRSAVRDTAGQVLTYGGQLIEATYFSCSGGRTEDAVAVWGTQVPYLQSVISPGEENAQIYTNTVSFSPKELSTLLGRHLTGNPERWLGEVTYTRGGGVNTMVLAGKTYTGVQLRTLLSLNSTAFTISVQGQNIEITTLGRGHRVGMSQYGADAMAEKGSHYQQILFYYYQGVQLTNLLR